MRAARLVVPLVVVIVAAVVAVALVGSGDDDGSNAGTSPDVTSNDPPADAEVLPEPNPRPESEARKNRVIARIQRAALEEAPDVAGPIISRSQNAGRITAAEAETLRAAARALARGKTPYELADTVDINDPGVGAVTRRSLAEITRRARQLARPILDQALDRGQITRSQAADIRAFVAAGAGYALP